MPDESDTVAAIARHSRARFLPYLPKLHSFDEDKAFYRNVVFPTCQIWVVEDKSQLVGFCAFKTGWLEHLYLLPSHVGRTFGETLLNEAKKDQSILQLWVFQRNSRAISFYQRHSFRMVEKTDGALNEERLPDALMEWRGPR